jgi:hypothetical protein
VIVTGFIKTPRTQPPLKKISSNCIAKLVENMKTKKDDRTKKGIKSDNFSVMETAIDLSIQEEYLKVARTIDFDNIDYKDVLRESKNLFFESTPIESKKRILILLAHFGTPESYTTIEKYLKISGQDFRNWVLFALKECRMFLESSLLDEDGGIISAGLGGKGNKLRYYFIISSKNDSPFSKLQEKIIEDKFGIACHRFNAEIEKFIFRENYSIIEILIPIDTAVGKFIEAGIKECNEFNDFLFFHYYVTNVNEPANEEILGYLEEIKPKKKESKPATNNIKG